MNVRDILKNAPNGLIIGCVTIVFVTVVTAFVVLAVTKSDATEFRAFLNTLLNIVSVIFAGGAFVTAGAAAKSAQKAEEQTNGALDDRIKTVVSDAITETNGGSRNGG